MSNVERAADLIARIRGRGAGEFCVCAGSRNSPLLAVLGASDARLFSFVDERSAAFFALGRIKQHGRPVAVVTTSGTAVAELLPAAVEAYYSSLPLILVTADRPARFRGTGAPQCIEQEGIFGPYAGSDFDGGRPVHFNIEFDEPLLDADPRSFSPAPADPHPALRAPLSRTRERAHPPTFRRPVVIAGELGAGDRERVRDFVLRLNAPVYAEPLSGLREDPALDPLLITAGERMIGAGSFDGVIRIGGVPALRFWRDLEESRASLPVVSFSRSRFAGLSRGEVHSIDDLPDLPPLVRDAAFFARDAEVRERVARILDEEPSSEPSIFREISRELPERSRVYLGNSLPIREWDLFASRRPRGFTYQANRGANGIDGQLSTFLGWCAPSEENVAVVGDLTAIYDLNAPWIVPQLEEGVMLRIVIVNNGGGRMFSRVASLTKMDPAIRERIVENAHSFRFDAWAAMWNLRAAVDERFPDAEATRRAWQRYDELWS